MRRTVTLTALCLTAALGLTACNPTSEDGGELATKAMKATRGASSLHVNGDISDSESGKVRLDLSLDKKGECKGTMGLGDEGTMGIIRTGGVVYMQYDEKMLRTQSKGESKADVDAAVKMLAGHWVKMSPTDPDIKDLAALCDLKDLLSDLKGTDTAAKKGKDLTVDGQKATTLTEKDGKTDYTLYVAAEGKPYILKTIMKGGDQPGTLAFSEFEKPVDAKAPAKKDIVDLAG
ncbi:hypothetical protein OG204_14335 [Streptomyces sp. NBC_01387]|uniref:hypothetical protein n=1 Tax=unclassified Streptomyces TaxID=2593676 RepID=UPI002023C53E|nr:MULTISPECIES: hypothetical protein [unclassified Streptomyces]MCX4550482.1 hypothetical protein [Streptomyces sp. NBC_01500]WSC21931.1 hypothetical protein OIE60_20835 [Streptomyces sp. NBC_01766]WSV55887.1 hypothetical protein OG282_20475 [Streptomyces sp. NBC_01014]